MRQRIDRQSEAFREALWHCKHHGLDWHRHLYPKVERIAGIDEVVGYYVLDSTMSTAVKTINM